MEILLITCDDDNESRSHVYQILGRVKMLGFFETRQDIVNLFQYITAKS